MTHRRLYVVAATGMCFCLGALARIFLPNSVKELHHKLECLRGRAEKFEVDDMDKYALALVFAEDHRFFLHRGVDLVGVCRAIVRTAIFRQLQGGSTIEQQLVRTITRDYRISFQRKIREVLLASTLHEQLNKTEVLNCYLAVAYFGTGLNGIVQATKGIKIPTEFLRYPSCYLVAHLRYPSSTSTKDPYVDRRHRRTRHIRSKLESLG